MKQLKYSILIGLLAFLPACDMSDPGSQVDAGGSMEFNDTSAAGQRIKQAIDDYNVFFKYEFSDVDYGYNWTSTISSIPYVKTTDQESIINVINYIDNEIFGIFPKEFIKQYMPPSILLVDSLKLVYTYDDESTDPEVHWKKYYSITGNLTASTLVIANVNKNFNKPGEEATKTLKGDLISLFVERLLANAAVPYPDEFVKVTDDFYIATMDVTGILATVLLPMYYPYWDGNFVDIKLWSAAVVDDTPWFGRAILKTGRFGLTSYSNEFILGSPVILYEYAKSTPGQDFGDYTAFILTKTPAEKQAFYDDIASKTDFAGTSRSAHPFGGKAAVEIMKQKVEIVKGYFLTNFGITLQEPH